MDGVEFTFEVGDQVSVLKTRELGEVLSRKMEWDPKYGEETGQYEVKTCEGEIRFFFSRELDLRTDVIAAFLGK